MTATTAPLTSPRRTPSAGLVDQQALRVEREDIVFATLRPGVLRVEVTVWNDGPEPTPPAAAALRSAPLGAFVPWQPLDVLLVPPLAPGRSTVVGREYPVAVPKTLGGVDRLPPDRVLVALGLGEPDRSRRRRPVAPPTPGPAPDLMAMLGLGGAHWAGNLNIFFPGADVERHTAATLRIYPGRVNLAMFIVGTGTADRYRFEFTGDGTAWNPQVHDTTFARPIAEAARAGAVAGGKWHAPITGLFLLAVRPPASAETGAVNVHVRQQSTGREAVVEFTMDARAAGPGCYTL